jgi:hypothetical protein
MPPKTSKPHPLYADSPERPRCPVCGAVSYSSAGIHPQCAVKQADAERMAQLAVKAKSVPKVPMVNVPAPSLGSWQRICPSCKQVVHVRLKTCTCGQSLAAPKRP